MLLCPLSQLYSILVVVMRMDDKALIREMFGLLVPRKSKFLQRYQQKEEVCWVWDLSTCILTLEIVICCFLHTYWPGNGAKLFKPCSPCFYLFIHLVKDRSNCKWVQCFLNPRMRNLAYLGPNRSLFWIQITFISHLWIYMHICIRERTTPDS